MTQWTRRPKRPPLRDHSSSAVRIFTSLISFLYNEQLGKGSMLTFLHDLEKFLTVFQRNLKSSLIIHTRRVYAHYHPENISTFINFPNDIFESFSSSVIYPEIYIYIYSPLNRIHVQTFRRLISVI